LQAKAVVQASDGIPITNSSNVEQIVTAQINRDVASSAALKVTEGLHILRINDDPVFRALAVGPEFSPASKASSKPERPSLKLPEPKMHS
jgi:hypothetical protein